MLIKPNASFRYPDYLHNNSIQIKTNWQWLYYYITSHDTSRPAYICSVSFDVNVKNANSCLCAIVMSLSNHIR